ncbi:MAG: DUF1592 domain-containing protein [Planctomycetota bacterium]|nr:DUF1592 domain-containing protein [Planctomycetota bacterium]
MRVSRTLHPRTSLPVTLVGAASLAFGLARPSVVLAPEGEAPAALEDQHYEKTIRPILERVCFECHGPDVQKGSVRIDELDPDFVGGFDSEEWHFALDVIQGAEMPPTTAPQMSDQERRAVVAWIEGGLEAVRRENEGPSRPVLRRLNRRQFTNALDELFGLGIDFGRNLPGDSRSRMGFTNNGAALQSSPLHIDTVYELARRAVKEALPVGPRPEATRYRVRFGAGIGEGLVAARTGGYQSVPLSTEDFLIEVLDANGAPREPRPGAEREALDALRREISVGLRGSARDRFKVVEDGMVLYGAVPHREVAPGAWQGPSPNAKLELQRVFPEQGRLAMRVRASRGGIWDARQPVLLPMVDAAPRARFTEDGDELVRSVDAIVVSALRSDQRRNLFQEGAALVGVDRTKPSRARVSFTVPTEGFYQIDLVHPPLPADAMPQVRLTRGKQTLDTRPETAPGDLGRARVVTTVGAGYLPEGAQHLEVGGPFFTGFSHLILTPLDGSHELVKGLDERSADLEARVAHLRPALRVYAGTRTDDGMDYATFGDAVEVTAPRGEPETHTFVARLENLPVPEPESGDDEILSGFLLLGLWNDHLVKDKSQTGPPLLVESIEVEAPFHPVWPPASYTEVFHDSPRRADEGVYAREVIAAFLERAFRRPVSDETVERYHAFWRAGRAGFPTFEESIQEVLTAALCSPNFLYMAEPETDGDSIVEADDWILASRLSFFLWDAPPDEELRALAGAGALRRELEAQVDRMLDDPRSRRFVEAFAEEWLRLDRLEQMTVDARKFPRFTRFVKRDMREETISFLERMFAEDLDVLTLVDSDWVMLNQNLAEFYGVEDVFGPEFRPVEVPREEGRGGLLSQGAFLVGHSDGVHPHPIKRAVWLKERILGDPPPPPPPNVPDLDPTAPGFQDLTLKEQLELHRDSASCRDCHAGIDPYGVAFERYGATGLLEPERKGRPVDASTTLPDGTAVDGVAALKRHLLDSEADAVALSFIEHLYAYALGRDVSFTDEEDLASILEDARADGLRVRAIARAICTSPAFQR